MGRTCSRRLSSWISGRSVACLASNAACSAPSSCPTTALLPSFLACKQHAKAGGRRRPGRACRSRRRVGSGGGAPGSATRRDLNPNPLSPLLNPNTPSSSSALIKNSPWSYMYSTSRKTGRGGGGGGQGGGNGRVSVKWCGVGVSDCGGQCNSLCVCRGRAEGAFRTQSSPTKHHSAHRVPAPAPQPPSTPHQHTCSSRLPTHSAATARGSSLCSSLASRSVAANCCCRDSRIVSCSWCCGGGELLPGATLPPPPLAARHWSCGWASTGVRRPRRGAAAQCCCQLPQVWPAGRRQY